MKLKEREEIQYVEISLPEVIKTPISMVTNNKPENIEKET